ncbi:transcription factor bHLH143-like [Coffea arabica]|uniref:Transcription factor bHLH143-like n=1 Tax=Coffea arabica TaxID=13443 RepID=A0ABM4VXB7_COFAR
MEKDFGSWFHHPDSGREAPCLNYLGAPGDVGKQNSAACMNPYLNELYIDGTFPPFTSSGLLQSKASQPNGPCNWFDCLPRFWQSAPGLNSLQKEKLPSDLTEKCGRTGIPTASTGCAQKKFLVFDQCDGQTTLIYNSGVGAPMQRLTSWNPKVPAAYDPLMEDLGMKKDMFSNFAPFTSYEHHEDNHGDDVETEMHEDTEELNALLYSDDENEYSDNDDDEVTSTGHSPSTMTEHGIQEWFEERGEEVASSASPTKRRKLLSGDYEVPSPVNALSSGKPRKLSEIEDDAESSCGNFDNQVSEESDSLSGKKRWRKEKIRETVSILQSIIPGGKGKDAVVVIDEAIHYLKSLKVKAKSLGLDAL